jgi:hypothetical protein
MRLLLDENLPRNLTALLAPESAAKQGWRGKDNGELIALALYRIGKMLQRQRP